MVLAHVAGGLSSWTPLYVLVATFVGIVSSLEALGASGPHPSRTGRLLLRIPNGLERLTGIPGWAAATVGTSVFALMIAGQGFESDVAWHIYTGRDKNLLTAPHMGIVLGLFLIGFAALLGILFASLAAAETKLRWRNLRIPWSTVPLLAIAASAVCGFPLDDLWHLRYGIDVTMWSPTHMLMIVGASMSPLATWLVLAEAGVRPNNGRWARGVHTMVAVVALSGFASLLGEYRYGVPQYQQLYHPVLLALGAGFALVAARVVLGRGWALGVAVIQLALGFMPTEANGVLGLGFVHPRNTGIYVGSAIAIELAAWVLGTDRRLRLALTAAIGIGTLGIATEYLYNRNAIQPWRAGLLPDAFLVGTLAAIGAAALGVAYGAAVRREEPTAGFGRHPGVVLTTAGIAVLVALAIPLPRRVAPVTAQVQFAHQGDRAVVTVALTPPSAADHATWFQVLSWQGGGLVVSGLHRHAGQPGVYVSDEPVPVTGSWKTMLRLSRGPVLMAVPLYLPADTTIPAPAVLAVDGPRRFVNERHILLREETGGFDVFAVGIEGIVLLAAALWVTAFVIAGAGVRNRRPVITPPRSRRRPRVAERLSA